MVMGFRGSRTNRNRKSLAAYLLTICICRCVDGNNQHVDEPMPMGASDAELVEFLQADIPSRTDGDSISILEVSTPSKSLSIGARMAHLFPETSWIVAGGTTDLSDDVSDNLYQVEELTSEKIQRMNRSPQMFEYLIISDFSETFLNNQYEGMSSDLGRLLTMARFTVVSTDIGTGFAAMFQQKLKETGETLITSAETQGLGLFVKHVKGKILTAETTSLARPVQHHYDDRRDASEGGTCYKYKLFHKTTSGVRGTPWLCQTATDPNLKGPMAPQTVDDCPADPECAERTIQLSNSNWVNLKLLAALGLGSRDKQRIAKNFLQLAEFKDCPTWNVCIAGSTLVWCDSDAKGLQTEIQMSEYLNKGCSRLDVGMKYDANPACCLDLLATALDNEHCGMTEEEAQSLNIGHAFQLENVMACRLKHFSKDAGFSSVKFQDSFIDDAQESFVFGSRREPSRMTKDEIISELQERGISTEVKPESSKLGLGNAKEQLIDRLEKARMDPSTLSPEELEADLRAMALSIAGSQEEKVARLQSVRQLAYKRVKSKLFKGRIKNRIAQLQKSVEGLSKDELKDYALEAGVSDNGSKDELVSKLKGAWKKNPELKANAIAALEKQLAYGDALYDIKMAEKEEKAKRTAPAQRAQPRGFNGINPSSFGFLARQQQPVWDAGSIADLGKDGGLGAPNVKHMSKKELAEEAGASGMSTAGTKQQLQVAVEKARRLGKSPATKVATQQAGGQPSNMGFAGGSGSSYPFGSPMSNSGAYSPFQLNKFADGLLQSASYDFKDPHKTPDKMSRQDLIDALELKGISTQGMSKEKMIEAAKKAGIEKPGGGNDDIKGIKLYMQQQQGGMPYGNPVPDGMVMPGMMQGGGIMGPSLGHGSLRDRLMAREQAQWGTQAGSQWGGSISRRQPIKSAERIAQGQIVVDLSKEALAAVLQAEGLHSHGTKEELLDRLVTRMTKEEMQEQVRLMKLDAKGTKMELKQRIIAQSKKGKTH